MNKVTDLEVTDYDFIGFLNDKYVYGSFCVSFKDQYPIVHVAYIKGEEHLDTNDVDIKDLEEQILATDDGKWYDEYQEAVLEHRRESSEDR